MTKEVKLTENFIKFSKRLGLKKPVGNPLFFHLVDRTTLDRSTIDIADTAICSYNEIKDDLDNVKILNTKIDENGKVTRDVTSEHSTIQANMYVFENKNTEVTMPDSVANDLISRNIVEEVT